MPEKLVVQQSGAVLFPWQSFFVTCWAQSSHFGVRSFSLGHNLGCTWLRHDHMSLRFYQERSVRQCLVCAHYSSIWHSMTGSAFPQSLPDPAAQQDLQRCSLRAGSWVVHQPLSRAQCSGASRDLGCSLSLPVLWEREAEAKEHSQHARDIMPPLFQTTKEKETQNSAAWDWEGRTNVARNLNADASVLAAIHG